MRLSSSQLRITWTSTPNTTYRVAFKRDVSDGSWTNLSGDVTATGATASYTDTTAGGAQQRFYRVYQVD